MGNIDEFEWGDILSFTLMTEDSKSVFTVLLEEDGSIFGNNLPEIEITKIVFRYATPIEIRNFMRWLNKSGRLFHPDFNAVENPEYYTSGKIECIDAMIAAKGIEKVRNFCECNAFKYNWRCSSKNGVEDLKKAKWYIDKFIELLKK